MGRQVSTPTNNDVIPIENRFLPSINRVPQQQKGTYAFVSHTSTSVLFHQTNRHKTGIQPTLEEQEERNPTNNHDQITTITLSLLLPRVLCDLFWLFFAFALLFISSIVFLFRCSASNYQKHRTTSQTDSLVLPSQSCFSSRTVNN